MKDLGEASFMLGTEIHIDRSRGFLGLSQKAYIDRVLLVGSLPYAHVCTLLDIVYVGGVLGRLQSNLGWINREL